MQGQLINKVLSLRVDEAIKAQAEVLISETVMTSQIEGEKYDLLSVRSSVHQKLGLSQAGLF